MGLEHQVPVSRVHRALSSVSPAPVWALRACAPSGPCSLSPGPRGCIHAPRAAPIIPFSPVDSCLSRSEQLLVVPPRQGRTEGKTRGLGSLSCPWLPCFQRFPVRDSAVRPVHTDRSCCDRWSFPYAGLSPWPQTGVITALWSAPLPPLATDSDCGHLSPFHPRFQLQSNVVPSVCWNELHEAAWGHLVLPGIGCPGILPPAPRPGPRSAPRTPCGDPPAEDPPVRRLPPASVLSPRGTLTGRKGAQAPTFPPFPSSLTFVGLFWSEL